MKTASGLIGEAMHRRYLVSNAGRQHFLMLPEYWATVIHWLRTAP